MRAPRLWVASTVLLFAAACGDGGSSSGDGGGSGGDGGSGDPTVSVSGSVIDFQAGTPITGSATITTEGLNATPTPTISTSGADFTIEGVPSYSVFFLLTGSPPTYRSTYNTATVVEAADVTGVQAEAVSEASVTELVTVFGVTPAAGTGILIARVVDDAGTPLNGFDGALLTVTGANGPFYLGADHRPDAGLTATSASGEIVWFDVPGGMAQLAAAEPTITVDAASAPIAGNVVTLARAVVTEGAPPLPTGVSFANDIVTMFDRRGCASCHSGNGPGRDRGGLTLDGGVPKIYAEVTTEISPNDGVTRVNLPDPPSSLILRLPGLPADRHPNITFASDTDPDYLLLLVWIQEGAQDN